MLTQIAMGGPSQPEFFFRLSAYESTSSRHVFDSVVQSGYIMEAVKSNWGEGGNSSAPNYIQYVHLRSPHLKYKGPIWWD